MSCHKRTHKARLVPKEYIQTYGIDHIETLAPAAKLFTKNAFLNGELEEVFMTIPPIFNKRNEENQMCKLKMSPYGIKQSPRE